MSSQKRCLFPRDFLFWDGNGFHWVYMYEEGMNVPTEFDIIDFNLQNSIFIFTFAI